MLSCVNCEEVVILSLSKDGAEGLLRWFDRLTMTSAFD